VIVVSDTGPLNYLLAIGQIEILPKLFGTIVVPLSVFSELNATDAPAKNVEWLKAMPVGFEVRHASHIDPKLDLDAGEREAICLAEEIGVATILIDERKGRMLARERGLLVVGTIGVIEKAAASGLLDGEAALEALQSTTFFAAADLFESALARLRKERTQGQ
jgi:predicted nucleic acid-binding protein